MRVEKITNNSSSDNSIELIEKYAFIRDMLSFHSTFLIYKSFSLLKEVRNE